MKKFLYMAVAAVAVLSSCSSNSDAILGDGGQQNEGVTTFTATIEGGATRVTLNDKTPNWEENDVISVDGHDYTASAAGTNVTFVGSGATESTHHSYFPKALYNGGTPTLPGVQTYSASKFDMPMYAECTDANLSFKNLCGVLAITVTSGTVKTISVISDATPLSGAFDVTSDAAVLKAPYSNQVILDCGTGVTASNTVFYVAVPAFSNANLQITVSDGTPVNDKVAQKTGVTIARNTIYTINFPASPSAKADNKKYHAWVQFEASGDNAVKWATMNIGASAETDAGCYGNLYKWGETPTNGNANTYTMNDIAGTNADVAKATWGTVGSLTWQMPTSAMLTNLKNNYKWEKVGDFNKKSSYSGYNVYLKKSSVGATYDASTDVHLFLPAAGCNTGNGVSNQGSYGSYWSSSPYNSQNNAYRLYFFRGSQGVDYDNRTYGSSVRAVLK